jgi:hypothetical protein
MLIGPNNGRETKGAILAADRDRLFDGQHHGGLRMVTCSKPNGIRSWRLESSLGRSG